MLMDDNPPANAEANAKTLSDEQALINAKYIIAHSYLFKDLYELQFSDGQVESDGYNRYIVFVHYQGEDSDRRYHDGDIIVYFRYLPETDKFEYKDSYWRLPTAGYGADDCINSIKKDEDFGWGTDPDAPSQGSLNYAEITTENFEKKVSLQKRDDWYDNGIVRACIAQTYGENYAGSFEYIGTNYSDFSIEKYGWTIFDVYKLVDPSGTFCYLLVPFTEEIGNPPTVYRFMDGQAALSHLWSGS